MTRKDYIKAAAVIADAYVQHGQTQELKYALGYVAAELADMFKADNSRFDREKFLDACKLEG